MSMCAAVVRLWASANEWDVPRAALALNVAHGAAVLYTAVSSCSLYRLYPVPMNLWPQASVIKAAGRAGSNSKEYFADGYILRWREAGRRRLARQHRARYFASQPSQLRSSLTARLQLRS